MVIKYVQSGLRDFSLLSYKRENTGRQTRYSSVKLGRSSNDEELGVPSTPELHRQFDDAIEFYKNKKECSSWQDAYDYLIKKYYEKKATDKNGRKTKTEIYPQPTLKQLTYYARKQMTGKDIEIVKTSEMEYRNDSRVLTASSETGVYAPFGLVEVDAVEFDVSLVDVDHYYLTVGRPIIYLMKDVLTRMIVAASIGFDNNAVVACVSCFANLAEDKVKLFRQYDIIVDNPNYWLTGYKPMKVRFDNGSDFVSKHIRGVCRELNIQIDTVPPGTGSYKGVIERSFHDAHDKLNKHFVNYGHIYDGKPYHAQASLTIHEFIRMFFLYIIEYNTTLNTGISLTPDMTRKGVLPIPAVTMQYFLGMSSPQPMPKGDELLQKLLHHGTAKLSRNGLTFEHLNYLNMEDEDLVESMQKAGTKRLSFPILYDPRSINMIYYVKDDVLTRARLNVNYKQQRTYLGMTFKEAEHLYEDQKELTKKAKKISGVTRRDIDEEMEATAEIAKKRKKGVKSSTKNMRENREVAKQKRSKELALEGRIGPEADVTQEQQSVPKIEAPTSPNNTTTIPFDPRTMDPSEYLEMLAADNFKNKEDK